MCSFNTPVEFFKKKKCMMQLSVVYRNIRGDSTKKCQKFCCIFGYTVHERALISSQLFFIKQGTVTSVGFQAIVFFLKMCVHDESHSFYKFFCFVFIIGASRGVCISQIFNSIHNFSQLFTTFHYPFFLSLVKLLNAGICISGIRPASGGVNLPKWTSSRHFRTSHSTQVHWYATSRSIL